MTLDSEARWATRAQRFTVGAFELRCHDVYLLNGENLLRRDNVIEYERQLHEPIPEDVLFFGPYVALPSGVCILSFHGRLDGELTLNFAHQGGGQTIKAVTISSFEQPLCIVIPTPVKDFEISGVRTPRLEFMRLETVAVEHIQVAP